MKIQEIPIELLHEAPWNSNEMDAFTASRLKASLNRYGQVQNLVVRPREYGGFEVLAGNQRLPLLREQGADRAMCVVVEIDEANAKLLAQVLNRVHGDDNPGLRAQVFREMLEELSQETVLTLLPETVSSLQQLVSLGHDDIAEGLREWNLTQGSRLKHFTAQLTNSQMEVVSDVIGRFIGPVKEGEEHNPNPRGMALFRLCEEFKAMEVSRS